MGSTIRKRGCVIDARASEGRAGWAAFVLASVALACEVPASGGAGAAGSGGQSGSTNSAGSSASAGDAGAPGGVAGASGAAAAGGVGPRVVLLGPGIYQALLDSGGSGGDSAAGASGAGASGSGGGAGVVMIAAPECFASVTSVAAAAPVLVAPRGESATAWPARELGGRHPLAGGCYDVGLTFVDRAADSPHVELALFDQAGAAASVLAVGTGDALLPAPGVAAFPDDTFAVVWTDSDDDELGIRLRKLDPSVTQQGDAIVANEQQGFAQWGADLVYDGRELVVAWSDASDFANGPDLRYRLFSRDLSPQTGDLTLAATPAAESDVALAAGNGSWAAAWRAAAGGLETIEAQSGASHWTVGPFLPGASDERPALVFLDASRLALAFSEGTDPSSTGTANVPRLFAAVLDPAFPGTVTPFPVAPLVEPYASDPTIAQLSPALERVGDALHLAWSSAALSGGAAGEELWQRVATWSVAGNAVTIDVSTPEQPLIASAPLRLGDQRVPALLAPIYGTSGNLISAWQDDGRAFGDTEGVPDVVLQVSGAAGGLLFSQVSLSENYFACAAVNDQSARCWGDNRKGQLGNGTTVSSTVPVMVTAPGTVMSVASAGASACALLADGTVRCWGDNSFAQLGDGTTTSRSTPGALVNGVTGAIAISAGQAHVCALIADGTVRCWGSNAYGQIGAGSDGTGYPIAARAYPVSGLQGVTAIAAGSFHTCALLGSGAVQCWGEGGLGQLGNGQTAVAWAPVTVSGIASATQIASGDSHSCAVLSDGSASCWGDETFGQLGNGVTGLTFGQTHSALPVVVAGLSAVEEIAAGFTFTCARLSDDSVACWGRNQEGELGDGSGVDRLTPAAVPALSHVVGIAASDLTACARLASGNTACWGYNAQGGVGNGTSQNALSPSLVAFP